MRVAVAPLILVITLSGVVLATETSGQEVLKKKISFKAEKQEMAALLARIEELAEVKFIYSPQIIPVREKVSLQFQNDRLSDVLSRLLGPYNIVFEAVGNQIVLRKDHRMSEEVGTEAQDVEVKVTGVVTDEQGEGMPGVNVVVKGTSTGASTDRDGKYQIIVPGPESVLIYTFLGYKPQEENVGSRTIINVALQADVANLDEVVVVAFGTQKKSSLVSSIETIAPAELKVPSSNLTTSLAGRLSGVIAYQRSGEPGQDNAEFFIRGVTTFGYKRDPLILIDGIETTTTELARLHADDIAAFSILKDATATALYGARGANGVIQITTKRGTEGPASVSFRAESSFSSNTDNVELADPITFMRQANEAVLTRNPLAPTLYSNEKIDGTREGNNPVLYPATDWRKMLVKRVTNNQRYNLNVSGGGNIARYYVSGVFNKDNGNFNVPQRSNFNNNINLKSYTLRSNISINLTKTTELITRLAGTFDDYTGPVDGGSDIYKKIIRANPVLFPAYYPAEMLPTANHILFGNASRGGGGNSADYINPYADLVKGYKSYSKSLVDAQFEMKQDLGFWVKGLSLSGIFNTARYSYFDINRAYNPYYYNIGYYNPDTQQATLELLNENGNPTEYLGYKEGTKDINSTLYLQGNIIYTNHFNKHDVGGLIVLQRREQLLANQGSLQKSLPYRNQGISGRFTYGFDNRYLAEFTFGFNGSERFDKNHRYGFFPAFGAGWIISNEKFWEPLSGKIQTLKIRGTYGLVGNDAIGDANDRFFYLSDVNLNDDGQGKGYTFGENYTQKKNGVTIKRYGNSDISWETARKLNLGIELGVFNDFTLLVDYFTEHRSNILMDRASIPANVGLASTVRANVGEARGRGVDMSLDYSKSFSNILWLKARGNFTYAHSEFLKYEEPKYAEAYRYHVGRPLNQIYGLVAERLFVDENEVNNSPKQNFGEYHAGDIKYRDMNGDGQITDLDMVPIGFPTIPEIVYGFGFSAGYKGLDISAFFQGSARSSFWIDATNTSPFQNDIPLLKAYADNHWSEENRNLYALWPRLSTNYNGNNFSRYTTWFMRNGAFLRVKTVEVGYTLPEYTTKKLLMSSARIYVSGTNLFILSGFKLWDIEMGGNGLGYPIQKVINVGAQIKF